MPKRKQNAGGKSPFSMRLASLRKEKDLKMENLAQAVGVSKSYISLLESGGRQPSRDVVLQIAAAIGPTQQGLRDELLILAGFAPVDTRTITAYQDALGLYEQSVHENPTDLQLFLRYILALIKSGRQTQAQERIQQGLQDFREIVQLQSLLAYSELSKGHFDAALINQETALRQYDLQPVDGLRRADLVFNLGSMHFMQGYAAQSLYLQDLLPTAKAQALTSYRRAADLFAQARSEAPDDPYMADEQARLFFNQAYLEPGPETWQTTITAYRTLLISPRKLSLGSQQLMESAAFLAHAYTQYGDLDQAELTLGLLSAFNPEYWLVHYLEACLHCKRQRITGQEKHLDLALEALERALARDSQTQTEALADPDLENLRTLRPDAFTKLLQKENSHP